MSAFVWHILHHQHNKDNKIPLVNRIGKSTTGRGHFSQLLMPFWCYLGMVNVISVLRQGLSYQHVGDDL